MSGSPLPSQTLISLLTPSFRSQLVERLTLTLLRAPLSCDFSDTWEWCLTYPSALGYTLITGRRVQWSSTMSFLAEPSLFRTLSSTMQTGSGLCTALLMLRLSTLVVLPDFLGLLSIRSRNAGSAAKRRSLSSSSRTTPDRISFSGSHPCTEPSSSLTDRVGSTARVPVSLRGRALALDKWIKSRYTRERRAGFSQERGA